MAVGPLQAGFPFRLLPELVDLTQTNRCELSDTSGSGAAGHGEVELRFLKKQAEEGGERQFEEVCSCMGGDENPQESCFSDGPILRVQSPRKHFVMPAAVHQVSRQFAQGTLIRKTSHPTPIPQAAEAVEPQHQLEETRLRVVGGCGGVRSFVKSLQLGSDDLVQVCSIDAVKSIRSPGWGEGAGRDRSQIEQAGRRLRVVCNRIAPLRKQTFESIQESKGLRREHPASDE